MKIGEQGSANCPVCASFHHYPLAESRANWTVCGTFSEESIFPSLPLSIEWKNASFQRVANKISVILQTEFAHEVRSMPLGGPGADKQLIGDLDARPAFRNEMQNLALACRQ